MNKQNPQSIFNYKKEFKRLHKAPQISGRSPNTSNIREASGLQDREKDGGACL